MYATRFIHPSIHRWLSPRRPFPDAISTSSDSRRMQLYIWDIWISLCVNWILCVYSHMCCGSQHVHVLLKHNMFHGFGTVLVNRPVSAQWVCESAWRNRIGLCRLNYQRHESTDRCCDQMWAKLYILIWLHGFVHAYLYTHLNANSDFGHIFRLILWTAF